MVSGGRSSGPPLCAGLPRAGRREPNSGMRRCRVSDIRTCEAEAGMGKATRIRQQNAREKIAAQRAAARRAEIRRRALWTGGAVVLVIAIVVAFVAIKLSG